MIAARSKVVEPRREAAVVLDALERMGYGDILPVKTNDELLDFRLAPLNMTFEDFVKMSVFESVNEPLKYKHGKLRKDGKPGFSTPVGKIEFTSSKLEQFGYDPHCRAIGGLHTVRTQARLAIIHWCC